MPGHNVGSAPSAPPPDDLYPGAPPPDAPPADDSPPAYFTPGNEAKGLYPDSNINVPSYGAVTNATPNKGDEKDSYAKPPPIADSPPEIQPPDLDGGLGSLPPAYTADVGCCSGFRKEPHLKSLFLTLGTFVCPVVVTFVFFETLLSF